MVLVESRTTSSHVISMQHEEETRNIHRKIAGRIAATATRRRPRQPGWSTKRDILRIGRRSLRAPSKRKMTVSEYHLPSGRIFALSSILIIHGRLCDYETFTNIAKYAFDSAKSRHLSDDDRRWLGVVFVIEKDLSSRRKGGDHTQPPEVFGDCHGCRRRNRWYGRPRRE